MGDGKIGVQTVIIFQSVNGWVTSASIGVPGLGVVKIEQCFSDALIDRMCHEAEVMLRQKLGQKEVCDEKSGQP